MGLGEVSGRGRISRRPSRATNLTNLQLRPLREAQELHELDKLVAFSGYRFDHANSRPFGYKIVQAQLGRYPT